MDSASGFFPGIFSGGGGAKSIVMKTSIVFGPKSQKEGGRGRQKFLREAPLVEESQASDSIM